MFTKSMWINVIKSDRKLSFVIFFYFIYNMYCSFTLAHQNTL